MLEIQLRDELVKWGIIFFCLLFNSVRAEKNGFYKNNFKVILFVSIIIIGDALMSRMSIVLSATGRRFGTKAVTVFVHGIRKTGLKWIIRCV